MDDDVLLNEAKQANDVIKLSRQAAEKFAEAVRDIAIDFIKNESRDVVKIGKFTIKYKHPWFLSDKYGKELEIKMKDECILSWIKINHRSSYSTDWRLNDLEMKEIKDLREFISELQNYMDLDLTAMFALHN
jgi:hypothetical protein